MTWSLSRISIEVVYVFSISSYVCGRNALMSHALQKLDMAIGQGSPFTLQGIGRLVLNQPNKLISNHLYLFIK